MTGSVRFKHSHRTKIIKMLKVTFYIQRKNTYSQDDDIVEIFDAGDAPGDLFRLVYSTPEARKATQFYMTRNTAAQYVVDLLHSLKYDSDPFEYFQVTTAIHPSIQYHISDLDAPAVRELIEEMVYTALKTPARKVEQ